MATSILPPAPPRRRPTWSLAATWAVCFALSLAAAAGVRWLAREAGFLAYWAGVFAFGTLWAETLAHYGPLRARLLRRERTR